MDIYIVYYRNSYANETPAISKIFIYHFQHKSTNIIDIQA